MFRSLLQPTATTAFEGSVCCCSLSRISKTKFAFKKVDNSLKEAVCLKGEQIKIAVEQDLEVR